MEFQFLCISKKDIVPKKYKRKTTHKKNIEKAMYFLSPQYSFDAIVLSYYDYPEEQIIMFIEEASKNMASSEIIIINGAASLEKARTLFRKGATDYFTQEENTIKKMEEKLNFLQKKDTSFVKKQSTCYKLIDYFIDQSATGVILLNEKIIIEKINLIACKILKKDKQDLINKVFPSIPDKLIDIFNKKNFLNLNRRYIEGVHLHSDSVNVFEYNYSAFPLIFNNTLKGMVLVISKENFKETETIKKPFYKTHHKIDQDIITTFAELALKKSKELLNCDLGNITIKDPISKEHHILAECTGTKINFPQKNTRYDTVEKIEHLFINGNSYFPNLANKNKINTAHTPLTWNNEIIGSINFFWKREQDLSTIPQKIIKNIQTQISYIIFLITSNISMLENINNKNKNLHIRAEKIKKLNREMADFGVIISHDLKAPIRAIAQLAQWIKADYYDKLDEQGSNMLDIMTQRLKRIDKLIEGMVMISKSSIEANRREIVDLNLEIKGAFDLISAPSNIKITYPNDMPSIIASKTEAHQVIQNLVSNAIKYNKNPNPTLDIWYEKNDKWAIFHVKDNGAGIPEKYHKKIFQIFQTLENKDVNDSTGIGLAIVKKYVNRLGGKITIDSVEKEYTDFIIKLPIKLIVSVEEQNSPTPE